MTACAYLRFAKSRRSASPLRLLTIVVMLVTLVTWVTLTCAHSAGWPGRPARRPRAARAGTSRPARRADRDRDVGARAADPRHQRRRVDRAGDVSAGRPAPGVAVVDPAAVVERREAPRRVVDPGPAPRAHPGPVAGGVRRPVGRHRARHPERAVFGRLLPLAVAIEVLGAGHLGRDVARRRRRRDAILGAVALVVPARERVARRRHHRVLRHAGGVDPELRVLAGRSPAARVLRAS